MKKVFAAIFCCVLIAGVLLAACGNQDVPKAVQEVYNTTLENWHGDSAEAVMQNLILSNATADVFRDEYEPILSHQVVAWKALGDKLWMVTAEMEEPYYGIRNVTHFVVDYDGRYLVVLNPINIPSECSEGIDLSPYMPDNELYPSDSGLYIMPPA